MESSFNINYKKSYIYFSDAYHRSWRSNIKSTLEFANKKIYATEKCLSEYIGLNPFFSDNNYEFYSFVEANDKEKKIFFLRHYSSTSFLDSKDKLKRNYVLRPDIDVKIVSNEERIIKIELDELFNYLDSNSDETIICKIKYIHKGTWYTLSTKCEYINFGKDYETNKIFVQPIFGELPFYDKGRINLAYFVIFIGDKTSSKLQIAMIENSSLILGERINLLSKLLQVIANLFKPLFSQFTYSKIIKINNSEITFFKIEKD